MSLITEYQDSNDRRKDLNTPKINVALPQTQGLKPADMSEITGAPAPAPAPAPTPQPAIAAPPSPVVPPQVETPAEVITPPPVAPQPTEIAPNPNEPISGESVDQFINQTLNSDISSITEGMPSIGGVDYDAVAGVQPSNLDVVQGDIDAQTQLMMEGKAVQSAIEDDFNLLEFQPTLIGGNSMPYLDDQFAQGAAVRAGLTEGIVQERNRVIEESFQPKPLPQTGTDPTKPRPDTTASFNRQWSGFFNDKLTPKNDFKYGRGQFGEAGNGLIGGLIYHLGLPQNLAYGAGLDIENFVQKSPLGGIYNKIGQGARGILQGGIDAIVTVGNAVNSKLPGMGQISRADSQLPKDFDPVRADPNFKGSYTMNALRGEQYNFSDPASGGEMGIVLPGNNPTFMFGLGGDVMGDPAGAAIALLRPFRTSNKVVRTAARAAEIAVDPISEAVVPALGTVTTSIWRGGQKLLPAAPTSAVPTGKPPKKGKKAKASQAGTAPAATAKKPQTINVTPDVDPAPPKNSVLYKAWQQRQAARKARAEAAKVKRVIIPQPPKAAVRHPDAKISQPRNGTIVTPEPPIPLTITMPGGKPATRHIPVPTAAQIATTDQAGKVVLEPITPGVLMREASEEISTRTPATMPGRKRADLEAEVVTTQALPEGKARPQLPGVTDDVVEVERLGKLVDEGEVADAASEVKRLDDMSRKTNQTPAIENDVIITPARQLVEAEVIGKQLIDVGDNQVVEGVEAAKVATQTLRRNEAELVRVASREAVAETLAPAVIKTAPAVQTKPIFQLVDTPLIKTVVDAQPDEAIVREILEEGGLTQPLKLNEVGVEQYELADPGQATLLASAQEAYRRDPRTAEMQNSFVYQKVREPKAKTAIKEAAVVEARQVVESIPVDVQPSIIPTVTESVFRGEMTVAEVAEQIANFRPGDVVDGTVVKKAKRTTKDLTALMKLTPHPTSGKPLIAANRGAFKTYKDIEDFLLKEKIEDPTYFRMFAREGAPIPPGALDGSAFKVVVNKPKPFNATPATVADNTVARVIAGQIEQPGALPGVKLDTSVKVSFDPSLIKPVSAANKSNDFRGQLNKQRNALRKQLDEVDKPEEMEKILERISEIDEELASPNLKANPGHLQQLQDEVIPDTQHGLSQEVLDLTDQKIQLEREVADIAGEARRLELDLADQEEMLEKAANKVIENTADIGRKELDDTYVPSIPANGITDQFFMTPDDITKVNHSNGTMYTSVKDAEFFQQNASIVMRALDQLDIPGGVDVVYLTKNMVDDMHTEDLMRLRNFIGDANNAAFYDNKSKKLFIRDALFDPEMDAAEATRIIVHELGHRLHFLKDKNVKNVRKAQKQAIEKSGEFISPYVRSLNKGKADLNTILDEDFAESVSYYLKAPYQFSSKFPSRARIVTEQIETAAAEVLNSKTFYHGTRTPNWEPIADPLTTQPRNVWGQGDYLYADAARAADDAQAEIAINTPGLVAKDIDMAGTVYEVKPNFERVLRATDKITPAIQRFFADGMEDVIGMKTPEARKAIKHFQSATGSKFIEETGTTKYPRYTVKEMYGVMEKYVHKYLGTEGITLPEETLSDLYRAVNLKIREAGYDAIFDNDLVVVLKPQKITAINKEVLGETDTVDVLVSRFNVDSQLARQNPASPSAQVNMMESGVRLQKELVEQTRTKFKEAQTEMLSKLQRLQETDDKLTAAAKKEQDAKRLSNIREGKANEKALNERLSKPNTDPCNF